MQKRLRHLASGVGGLALVSSLLAAAPLGARAEAATATTSFAAAKIKADSSGEVLHTGAVTLSGTSVADAELGYATSSINSAGLTTALRGDKADGDLLIQPAQQAGVKAYGSGDGLAADLSASTPSKTILPGVATETSPPINNTIKRNDELATSNLLPGGLLAVGQGTNVLNGQGNANYPGTCPIGRPIAYAAGETDDANLMSASSVPGLNTVASSLNSALSSALGPLLTDLDGVLTAANLPGLTASASSAQNPELVQSDGETQTLADTYLSPNGGGTWGVSSFESVEPAPIRINLLGLVQLNIAVVSANTTSATVPSPLRLLAKTTGKGSGASVALQDTDVVNVSANVLGRDITLTPPGGLAVGTAGATIPLNLKTLLTTALDGLSGSVSGLTGSLVSSVESSLPSISLGSLTVGGKVTSTASGNRASGSFDLAHLDISPDVAGTTTNVVDLALDHLETSVRLNEPVHCSIPTSVTAGAATVGAGKSATLTVKAGGSDSMAGLLACTIKPATVTEHVTSATTRFSVADASSGGSVHRNGNGDWTVTWTGKTIAGSNGKHNPGSAPLTLTDRVDVPSWAKAGTVKTSVTVRGNFADCNNGTEQNPYKTIADSRAITGSSTHTVTAS